MTDRKQIEQSFHRKASELLDESVDRLDGPTLSKLHQARSRALEAKSPMFNWQAFSGAGALAASVAMVFVLFDTAPEPLPVIYEDPVQLAAAQEIELMDDLDFVAWLVLQETEDAANAS